ncbi:CAAX amino terminal membrane bound protease [Mesoplasma florum L1]|uniref:CAAX amino terminal membrane bound protease n=1 Tax=Mesoplasma florum (strain ATCC 33453 / NBRC 100688 / NCTC 11704 / L1) TaxID=265311 RepID=Q6F0Q1_MESFL|nr:type II CAAX endopeptidase family protein [Mesoplasma florum]AAT75922.1 CAAX amino terminal membrane bound protease [Mesoplasma florum L1]AVN59173.1 CPBP family intramembrane metalloprotease domain-containing protein [Mesoplasma florum]AVN61227.1 CPBP family intramembrane metalloprotease domain-containing protein [Mesoplasma florum]
MKLIINKLKNFMKSSLNKMRFQDQLPEEVKFKFNVFNPLIDGIIFATSVLFVPLIVLIILKFTINANTEEDTQSIINLVFVSVQIFCSAIGCFVLYKRDNELFTRTNAFGIYAFIVLPFLFVIILGSLFLALSGWNSKNNPVATQFVSMTLQIIAEVVVGIILFIKVPFLKDRIFLTLKKEWKKVIVVVLIMTIVLFAVSFGLSFIEKETANQNALSEIYKNSSITVKIFYSILLFIFSVVVAPLVEELAFRDSIFTGVGNKWFAMIISSLAFAMVHVGMGDVQNIYIYLIPSIILSATFIYTEGNVTYSWLVHLGSNLITFIWMIAGRN